MPFLFFLITYGLSAAFGVDPLRSFRALPATAFFALTVLATRTIVVRLGAHRILLSLFLGQGLAALHSVLAAAFPSTVRPLFLGAVTESGQLALTTVVLAGCVLTYEQLSSRPACGESKDLLGTMKPWLPYLMSGLASSLLVIAAMVAAKTHYESLFWVALCSGLALCLSQAGGIVRLLASPQHKRLESEPHDRMQKLARGLLVGILPLLLAALLINLKRGPWMGVFLGGGLFLLLYRPRVLVPLLGAVIVAYASLAPVRERIAEIPEHFYISGGRSVMWDIGVELATRYPLGVGLRNSRFLQSFSADIPKSLDHFHNNYINILVEGGWLALCFFLWWLVGALRFAFQKPFPSELPILSASIGAALISWQIAGLVEYNWGDSEVRILVYVLLGVLTGLAARAQTSSSSSNNLPTQ